MLSETWIHTEIWQLPCFTIKSVILINSLEMLLEQLQPAYQQKQRWIRTLVDVCFRWGSNKTSLMAHRTRNRCRWKILHPTATTTTLTVLSYVQTLCQFNADISRNYVLKPMITGCLFNEILESPGNASEHLLPPALPPSYDFRKRPHTKQILNRCSYRTDCSFITRRRCCFLTFTDWCYVFFHFMLVYM